MEPSSFVPGDKERLETEIAERKRAEEALRQAEQRNRAVLSSLKAHIAVVDHEGTIVIVNEAWTRFALANGVTDLARVSPGANYLGVCRLAIGKAPEAEPAMLGIQSILAGSAEEFTLEYPCDSTETNRWFQLSATPLNSGSGSAVICHSDVTHRVQIERRLQQSEQHYRALIDNALDILSILDRDGVMLYASQAIQRNLGYTPEEMIGTNVLDLVHPDDHQDVIRALELAARIRELPQRVELRARHKDGTWRCIESIGINHMDNPFLGGIIVNSRDITERRKAEAALREKEAALERTNQELQSLTARVLGAEEQERRRIARDLHDDLNQSLALVAVDLGACIRQVPVSTPEQMQSRLRIAQESLAKLSEGVRSMAHQLHPAILDDLGLVVALRSYCQEFSRRQAIDIRFVHRSVPSSLPQEVRLCIYRIAQEALWNVARHANTKRAFVVLSGRPAGIGLRVRDHGAGFDPGSPESRRGLGLISMEERARIVGGTFEISSRRGRGVHICVQIPLQKEMP